MGKTEPSEEERAERAKLRVQLKDIPRGLSQEAREKFEEIEGKHTAKNFKERDFII
jgi:hypothetical protein